MTIATLFFQQAHRLSRIPTNLTYDGVHRYLENLFIHASDTIFAARIIINTFTAFKEIKKVLNFFSSFQCVSVNCLNNTCT